MLTYIFAMIARVKTPIKIFSSCLKKENLIVIHQLYIIGHRALFPLLV